MSLFLIERNFAQPLELTQEDLSRILRVEAELGVRWIFSFLSSDKKKTYCIYRAPDAEALREAARRLNEPADVIKEVRCLGAEALPI
ncbi:MAG: DUF4242 domain-containing protein [Dehalococcoidia bacterium]